MLSRRRILACLLLLFASDITVKAKGVSRGSRNVNLTQRRSHATQQQPRHLQNDKNNKNNDGDAGGGGKNNDNDNNDKKDEEDEEEEEAAPPTLLPTLEPSPKPSLPPTVPPVTQEPPEEEEPEQTFETGKNNQFTISLDKLRDIQYFGGGEITLRFSLWFQDDQSASKVGVGPTLLAVLHSMQQLLCHSDADIEGLEGDDPLGLSTLDWTDAAEEEERELCVVPVELGGPEILSAEGQKVEGSVLLQPPTTFVVDRIDKDLSWTSWRVTWDVLRLGTFYILQGLENSGGDAKDMDEEEIYRSGINAMQGILELALQVSIREQSFDKVLVGSMVNQGQSGGMVLASVYGEEAQSLVPKLEWLGLTQPDDGAQEGSSGNLVEPTEVTNPQEQGLGASTTSDAATADAGDDDEWDDDHYSMVYGITEPLDPPFWHPLRVVGILMFLFTTAALFSLSWMSRKRQAAREIERKMAKEGLLSHPQGVEDMLNASATQRATDASPTMPSKSYSSEAQDPDTLSSPMPSSLQMT